MAWYDTFRSGGSARQVVRDYVPLSIRQDARTIKSGTAKEKARAAVDISGNFLTGSDRFQLQSGYTPAAARNPGAPAQEFSADDLPGAPGAPTGSGFSTGSGNSLAAHNLQTEMARREMERARRDKELEFARQQRDLDIDRRGYETSLGIYQQESQLADEERAHMLNEARNAANLKRGRIGEAIGTQRAQSREDLDNFLAELGRVFGRREEDLNEQNVLGQRQLRGSYSARGLSDSSFAGEAMSNLSNEFNRSSTRLAEDRDSQRTNAERTFRRNLDSLDREERQQYEDIDTYLRNLEQQAAFQTRRIDLDRYATSEEYRVQADNLTYQAEQIRQARERFQNDFNEQMDFFNRGVTLEGQSIRQAAVQDPARVSQDFSGAINSLIANPGPSDLRKSTLERLVGQFYTSEPERKNALNWYDDWINANIKINQGLTTPQEADEHFTAKYGQPAFALGDF